MQCFIVSSQDRQKFKNIKSITLPAIFGKMQILPNHAEIFIILQKGEITLEGNKNNILSIKGGVCHVKDNVVNVIL